MQPAGKLTVRERLAEEYLTLLSLERDRKVEQNPHLGQVIEQGIIQRELLELELQDLDDQLERIRRVSADVIKAG